MNKWIQIGLFALPIGFGGVAFAQSASDTGNSVGSPSVVSPSDNANTVDKKDTFDDSRRTSSQKSAGVLDDRAGMENPSSTSGSDDSQIHRSSGTDDADKSLDKRMEDSDNNSSTMVKKHKHIKKTTKTQTPQSNSMEKTDDFKSDTTLKSDTKAPAPIDQNITP